MTGKCSSLTQLFILCIFLASLFILHIALPDKAFSEQENRYLAEPPKFSFNALFSGKFISGFEDYVTEQFPGRDYWISMKSRTERLLLKTENNDVFFCSDDTLISRFEQPDPAIIKTNTDAINKLCENSPGPVYFALIPGAVSIWEEKLPPKAVTYDQHELIDRIYSGLNTINADIYSVLEDHDDEYIYYRTDHHWTSLGAYYGFTGLADAVGFSALPLSEFNPQVVSHDFYGTVYSSSGVRWVKPDSIEMYVPEPDGLVINNYPNGTETNGMLYDYSKLDVKDKYAFFLGGNTPMLKIYTGSKGPVLLVLRDSYFDCLLPFLLPHFSQIHVIDLRYYRLSISEYIAENRIDEVLAIYSVDNFTSDAYIFMAGR